MNRTRLYWLLQIVGWGGFALVTVILASLSGEITSIQIWAFIVLAATNLIFSHFLRHIVKTYNWFKLSIHQLFFQSFLAIVALSLANFVAQILINIAFGILNPVEDFKILVILSNIFLAFLLFALWFVMYFLVHFLDNYNTSLKYEAKINEIRLNHLKSQLNPHFIFNALNSVRALVDEDPIKAKTAITRISNMLRFSLMMDKKQTIEFGEELNTVKDYLELESIRFEERLEVVYHIEDESYSYKIPPMMLQTIVENAIKHGISNLIKGGTIDIRCSIGLSQDLYIMVKNSGQLKSSPSKKRDGSGHGISNTVQRLKLIYGNRASFKIFNYDHEFVVTEIKIPKQSLTLEYNSN